MNNRRGFRQGGAKPGQAGGRKFETLPFKKNANDLPPKVGRNLLTCPDVTRTSAQDLQIHSQTSHRRLENLKGKFRSPGKFPEHIRKSVFLLKDYVQRTDREPLIGLQHILEYRLQVQPHNIETKYYCEICQLDSDLATMLEHLCSFRHRKIYMAKRHPYVLRAPSSSKEDRMQYMRRMAMEIEQQEGTQDHRIDPVIRTVPIMVASARPSRPTTRWDSDGDREKRKKKALEYLQSFEIDNDSEASTVTRLAEKLTAELKYYSDKLKEEALFPAKVARAKDVAMTIMQNAAKNLNPGQEKQMHNAPQGRLEGPAQPNSNKPFQNTNPAFQQRPQDPPFQPPNQIHSYQTPPPQPFNPNMPPQTDQTPEDMTFLKKLMTLLKVLPQSGSITPETSQLTSKLLMLKSLLQDQTGTMPVNQLSMQVASLTREMANMNNMSLNQQWTMMSSQNTGNVGQCGPDAMEQIAAMAKNAFPAENAQPNSNVLMQIATLLQNRQVNANALLPENHKVLDPQYMQMDNGSRRPMDQGAYMEGQPYSDIGYDPGVYGRDWNDPSYGNIPNRGGNRDYADYPPEEVPYTRVCLSPGTQRPDRFQDNSYNQDFRRERLQASRSSYGAHSSRSFDPGLAEGDGDLPYGKRVKLESNHMTSPTAEWGRHYPEEGGPTDASNLSVDLLKRIRGKDLFTVSAILSEYVDKQPK